MPSFWRPRVQTHLGAVVELVGGSLPRGLLKMYLTIPPIGIHWVDFKATVLHVPYLTPATERRNRTFLKWKDFNVPRFESKLVKVPWNHPRQSTAYLVCGLFNHGLVNPGCYSFWFAMLLTVLLTLSAHWSRSTSKSMNSTDIMMANLNRSRKNQHVHIEDIADIELGEYDDVRNEFAASLKDSIVILKEKRDSRTNKGEAGTWAEPELIKVPNFLKLRVYLARLLRWWRRASLGYTFCLIGLLLE